LKLRIFKISCDISNQYGKLDEYSDSDENLFDKQYEKTGI